jgi:predicted O-methyltransferase YrrM
MLLEDVFKIHGFLSPAEAELLYRLATEVPIGGTIVEIGSFQGRSTVCLGLGAKQVPGVQVYAIDPHEDLQVNETTRYGMHNNVALLKNLVEFEVADIVHVIALESMTVTDIWVKSIDLLWIDGSHQYRDVSADLISWSRAVSPTGRIALHDSSGNFPDVSRALDDFLIFNTWKVCETVDATTVLERASL